MDVSLKSWQVALMKCAALQLNLIVGDFDGNARKIQAAVESAADAGAELCVNQSSQFRSYPARDLLLNPGWVRLFQSWVDLHDVSSICPPTLVGFANRRSNELPSKPLQNAAALLRDGKVETVFAKEYTHLRRLR